MVIINHSVDSMAMWYYETSADATDDTRQHHTGGYSDTNGDRDGLNFELSLSPQNTGSAYFSFGEASTSSACRTEGGRKAEITAARP